MSVSHEIVWTKPNPGTYKLNLDAAFHYDDIGVMGVVLHNNSGEAIASTAEPISHVLDAGLLESLAMLKGI